MSRRKLKVAKPVTPKFFNVYAGDDVVFGCGWISAQTAREQRDPDSFIGMIRLGGIIDVNGVLKPEVTVVP